MFLCRAVGKVDAALPWNEYHALPLEGSELRRETDQHFGRKNCVHRFPLVPLGQKNVVPHIIWMVKWSDEFLRLPVFSDSIMSCPALRCINWNVVALRDISWGMASPLLNESAITIIEELTKYLDCAWNIHCAWNLHLFVVNLVISLPVSSRRHMLQSLKSSMTIFSVISFNT